MLIRGDVEDLAVRDSSVDLIVSRLALHYMEDLPRILTACHRALAPGGRIVITVLHPVITSRRDAVTKQWDAGSCSLVHRARTVDSSWETATSSMRPDEEPS